MPIQRALKTILDRTGYRAIAIGGGGYRIVRKPAQIARKPRRAVQPQPSESPDDLIVTASKQSITLLRFPGTIARVTGFSDANGSIESPTLDDLAHTTPVLQNTALGDGRNKTFIRGIADSSFNGATQSTASTYFGDVQLGYSGPGPALRLHDVQSVEVMEGPQGTLYGAGAIGGIIRITPNPVVLNRTEGALTAGLSAISGGAPGYDLSAMINAPLIADHVGIRAVAYRQRTGGYIDGAGGRSDVNGMNITGGRAELRAELPNGWDVTAGALTQAIGAAGAQYAERPAGPLAQFAAVPQPFSNRVRLGRLIVSRHWDSGLQFTSATGIVGIHSADIYDATGLPGTVGRAIYDDSRNDLLISQETRLSRSTPNGASWLMGFTLIYDRNAESRTLGTFDTPAEIIGVTNVTKTASAFGEATIPVTSNLSVTVGGRVTTARTDGNPSIDPRQTNFVHGRSTFRFDPTLAMSWLLGPRVALYGRLQSGFRTGGLAVARGVGLVSDFRSDEIKMAELGLRIQRHSATGLAVTTAVSYAHWSNIQADLINRRGQPYTANIGDAEIYAFEATADWVPVVRVHAALSLLYTYNRVSGPIADSSVRANRRLPDTPPLAANVELGYRWPGAHDSEYRIGATARYVGRSVLGSGDFLDISQGQYGVVGLSGGWRLRNMDFSLNLDNLTNSRANRFSFGNPFTFFRRDQTTPVQPLTVRLGAGFAF
jgi:iron complex outermembrane receptor protein